LAQCTYFSLLLCFSLGDIPELLVCIRLCDPPRLPSLGQHYPRLSPSTSMVRLRRQCPHSYDDHLLIWFVSGPDPCRVMGHDVPDLPIEPSTRRLTKAHQLAVLNRTSPVLLHTSSLFVTCLSWTQTCPSPSTSTPFYCKLRTNITNARHNLSTHHVSVLSASLFSPGTMAPTVPLPTTVTVLLVPLQVPHAPSVPLLLVYVLGIRNQPFHARGDPPPPLRCGEIPIGSCDGTGYGNVCECENSSVVADSEIRAGGAGGGWLFGQVHSLQSRHVEERAWAWTARFESDESGADHLEHHHRIAQDPRVPARASR
jgi:hypothetical protein